MFRLSMMPREGGHLLSGTGRSDFRKSKKNAASFSGVFARSITYTRLNANKVDMRQLGFERMTLHCLDLDLGFFTVDDQR
ncbi:hypothetical protein EZJ58_5584 [Sodalis ligni]|uniref:Uncharacterized protein n=1 Tax=Sodalis ligni TaxID=2697027 RepID=A0A4R1NJF5_9GAMM|nr:hypothetical protein EZJ58_5584 [Sodalis ligni]